MSADAQFGDGEIDIADLCFTARALAQTHPMTEQALRYRQDRFVAERQRQPATEIADWASTALLVGYCLRRAEEQVAPGSVISVEWDHLTSLEETELEAGAVAVADQLRVGDTDAASLLPGSVTVSALDRIIATELDKRNEHLREQLDDDAWAELEDYVAWWVVHGYGLRATETAAEDPRP